MWCSAYAFDRWHYKKPTAKYNGIMISASFDASLLPGHWLDPLCEDFPTLSTAFTGTKLDQLGSLRRAGPSASGRGRPRKRRAPRIAAAPILLVIYRYVA